MKPDAESFRRRDRECVWHPYSRRSAIRNQPFPVIERGEGVYLVDVDGRRYLDAISSWWCCNLGHGHPRIVEAIRRQAGELQHSILGNMSHPRAIELSERLAALFPAGPRRVMYASDGACAVEAGLKIALQTWHNRGEPRRRLFASLRGCYHGDTLGAVSVGYIDSFHAPLRPVLFDVLRAESPCCSTCPHGPDSGGCRLECFESMQRIFDERGAELAAVIVEPLCQGAGGMRLYGPRYLERLAACCRASGALLILDEVAVGFGRTGRMFAFRHAAGVDPDIVCMGKGLTAGYLPVSATVVKGAIADTFDDAGADRTFYHGHTFAGNPIGCAAGLEALRVYDEEGIVARAAAGGELMREGFDAARGLSAVADVRGLGMIGVVELKPDPPGGGEPLARRVQRRLLEAGVLVRPLGEVLYLMPPLVTPPDVLRELASALVEAIRAEA